MGVSVESVDEDTAIAPGGGMFGMPGPTLPALGGRMGVNFGGSMIEAKLEFVDVSDALERFDDNSGGVWARGRSSKLDDVPVTPTNDAGRFVLTIAFFWFSLLLLLICAVF